MEQQTINKLISLGFAEERAKEAVAAIGDKSDVEMGYNWLLDHGEEDRGGPVQLRVCSHVDMLPPLLVPDCISQKCVDGCESGENWLCLHCEETRCSRYVQSHNKTHYEATKKEQESMLTVADIDEGKVAFGHCLAIGLQDLSVWCYECNHYVRHSELHKIAKKIHAWKFGQEVDPIAVQSTTDTKPTTNNESDSCSSHTDTPSEVGTEVTLMFGAIVGDIAGSTYEHNNCKLEDKIIIFRKGSEFTDDSVLTLATASHLLNDQKDSSSSTYTSAYQTAGNKYPNAGYGGSFKGWLWDKDSEPYNSWGNGSAMRASPIAWAAPDLEWALEQAKQSASVTHNHPEGIKGAQAVVAATYLARTGHSKDEIKAYIAKQCGYNLDRTIAEIRPGYRFDVSCQGSVPEAILAFLESKNFRHALVLAISLGGDSDTIACITGAIAHAYYKSIPSDLAEFCRNALDSDQLAILDEFWEQYPPDVSHAD